MSKSRGKASQRLKQRRQPWQISKMRCISASTFSRSAKSGSSQLSGCRIGASRLPSRMDVLLSFCRNAKGATLPAAPLDLRVKAPRSAERVERLLEAARVGLLRLGEGLEPVGDLVEAFLAGGARHARVHVGVLVGLAGDRGLEIVAGDADRLAGRGIARLLEELEMAVGVAGLALGGRAEHGSDVVIALDVGLLREIEIAAVGLALASERGFQITLGLRAFERRHGRLLLMEKHR